MSKRQSRCYSGNEIKKQKLDVYTSSERFPSVRNDPSPSQNSALDDEAWGDEDDAIFLIAASQAYEENKSNDMSAIAEHTMCMRPPLTCSQIVDIDISLAAPLDSRQERIIQMPKVANEPPKPTGKQRDISIETCIFNTSIADRLFPVNKTRYKDEPSTSSNDFECLLDENLFNDDFGLINENKQEKKNVTDTFKKPSPPSIRCKPEQNTKCTQSVPNLSSVSVMASNEHMQNMLKQLKSCKLSNENLKQQYDLLTDKCMIKDGEVSMLRSQMKSMQMQMDAIKLDKMKTHEKNQTEWNTAMHALTKELHSCKSQIEFKNLEINSANERCRILETSKIKFVEPVQPTLDNSFRRLSYSQKFNSSMRQQPVAKSFTSTKESTCQTISLENIQLHSRRTPYYPLMDQIHESIFHQQQSTEVPVSFRCNKNTTLVEHSSFSYIRKRILKDYNKSQLTNKACDTSAKLENVYEDLSKISKLSQHEIMNGNSGIKCALRITLIAKELLIKTLRQLQSWLQKTTAQTLREMDTQYLEMSGKESTTLSNANLFSTSSWCKNEQAMEARRITAVVSIICKNFSCIAEFVMGLKMMKELNAAIDADFLETLPLCYSYRKEYKQSEFLEIILEILKNIGNIGCSHLFTGLLTSLTLVVKRCIKRLNNVNKCFQSIFDILKHIVLLRPNGMVILEISKVLKQLSRSQDFLEILCDDRELANVIPDMSQGVDLFNNESCFLQLLCSQIEVSALQHYSMKEMNFVFEVTEGILNLCYGGSYLNVAWASCRSDYRCHCSCRIYQCLAVCLHICSRLYKQHILYLNDVNLNKKFNSTIRAGIMMLNFCVLRDIEFITRLGNHEGNYQLFIENCNSMSERLELLNIHKQALADLTTSVIIPFFEEQDSPPPDALHIWELSFNKFSTVD